MMRLKLPALPLDEADRRVIGIAIIIMLAFLLVCLVIGAGLGAGVFAFYAISGLK